MEIPKTDLPSTGRSAHSLAFRLYNKLWHIWLNGRSKAFWSKQSIMNFDETHQQITQAIHSGQPRLVGRLGGVEASILIWARDLPRFPFACPFPKIFSNTSNGADIAGIRPRNKHSYREFANLLWQSLQEVDLHGAWVQGYEAICLEDIKPRPFFNVEFAAPNAGHPNHWIHALKGKKILIVSPFKNTIERQIPKFGKVWPQIPWGATMHFEVIQFPYLIQPGCPEAWWEVYERIGKIVSAREYDLLLLGCGGLGLPLASLAKKAGRVALHLGGHLQLLFGIFGQRHLDQEWHRKSINSAWTRPAPSETPECAPRVEGGGYW